MTDELAIKIALDKLSISSNTPQQGEDQKMEGA